MGAGETFRGFASSFGQRNWFSASTFNVDWSLHLRADKATKSTYAGNAWDDATLSARLRQSVAELEVLGRELVLLQLVVEDAQVIVCFQVGRVLRDDLLVDVDRLVDPSLLDQVTGQRQSIPGGCRRDRGRIL